ncbi:MAG: S-methyl-5'-thioadenosine phosphorylase [Bacillota bacterium]
MRALELAIIGGTGVYDPGVLSDVRQVTVDTPYGTASALVGKRGDKEIAFMARHGYRHTVPPHMINHRANIAALKMMGVKRVMATCAVGSMNTAMPPGSFVFMDQFIDFAKSEVRTFFDGGDRGVVHVDYTNPYCPEIRAALVSNARRMGIIASDGGCYVCTDGPRFETPAEIRMFQMLGGDIVGMTGVPEVVLAREAGMCYASIAMVTNWAAGITGEPLGHSEVVEIMQANGERLRELMMLTIDALPDERHCACGHNAPDMPWLGRVDV